MKRYLMTSLLSMVAIGGVSPMSAHAQRVSARLSTREAYVGMPFVLQLQIADANNYELPEDPQIDGCDVRSAGVPSQSSQITIINGRRSESRSVTAQYVITPRRAGRFEVPSLELKVDGRPHKTEPVSFVATKSETGDLLFVEIEGSQEKVYVGQSLDLKLKIWIKPFRDRKNRIELNEGQMWQMLSETTSWGKFADRLQEMAENQQRPRGVEVLRDNGDGNERSYFLYEVNATVYPTRPGRIDGNDVQVVVNYPVTLGRSRDPFGSMFADDFFGSSPFGSRLRVKDARPIVADVTVDATEVVPVPTAGRPADYRGAVGKYRIVAEAEPNIVAAGDPITLRIGVLGDGPMELVQSPPLHEISEFTDDFKVMDQAPGGFVKDNTKVFVTTIRPRRAGVSEIPPIPFSFFDPEKERYETVYTEAISITVNESEMLSMDSIVSNSIGNSGSQKKSAAAAMPDFTNRESLSLLNSMSPPSRSAWKYFAVIPAMIWLLILVWKMAPRALSRLPRARFAKALAERRLNAAQTDAQIAQAMVGYVSDRSGEKVRGDREAVGLLRVRGLFDEANQLESFFDRLGRFESTGSMDLDTEQQGNACKDPLINLDGVEQGCSLLNQLESAMATLSTRNIRRTTKLAKTSMSQQVARTAVASLVLVTALSGPSWAEDSVRQRSRSELTSGQRETILLEANNAYRKAEAIAATDQAEALELFTTASRKYQLLVDEGIQNSDLFMNLANSYLRSGECGYAICNYHRVLRLDPSNPQALDNLRFAKDHAGKEAGDDEEAMAPELTAGIGGLARANLGWLQVAFAVSSVVFWALLTLWILRVPFPTVQWSLVPLVPLLFCGAVLFWSDEVEQPVAIIVAKEAHLRTGDGLEFPEIASIESAEGLAATIVDRRQNWVRVETAGGQVGWLPQSQVEAVVQPL
ncbi:MAG: hypothetical protein GY768_12535 [Planctomycetaceae bacterium]|nr:hypothetical protein [Planctomycetaceae bacterium]